MGEHSLLEFRNVERTFTVRLSGGLWPVARRLKAVDGVSFSVPAGSSYGVAGESGSGKTTLARLALLLDRPSGGEIRFDGRPLHTLNRAGRAWFRSRVQAVFQDATASLNPRMHIRDLIAEPLEVRPSRPRKSEIDERVDLLLAEVGLPTHVKSALPHQLSGGQRQRVAIARALISNPDLIVLDEPVSALDVSIRSQVLNLLLDVQERKDLTYLLIAHDLALLRHVTNRIAVMYLGRVVEEGETEAVLFEPRHPYTQALLAAVPRRGGRGAPRSAASVRGEIGTALALPTGCRFHPRCPFAEEVCREIEPVLELGGSGHRSACHFASRIADLPSRATLS